MMILSVSHGLDGDYSTVFSVGALITKRDVIFKGHQKETLSSVSFIQCSLQCLKRNWCISINFEIGKTRGKCSLNDAGVRHEFAVSVEQEIFKKNENFIYSQLRPYLVSISNRIEISRIKPEQTIKNNNPLVISLHK